MKTLLIVDDEVLLAEGLRAMLADAFRGRLQVLRSYSAAQALEIAENTHIDILLTDINMPDSFAALRPALKAIARSVSPTCSRARATIL